MDVLNVPINEEEIQMIMMPLGKYLKKEEKYLHLKNIMVIRSNYFTLAPTAKKKHIYH